MRKCDFVDYNVRAPGGGFEGLSELDVIGLNMTKKSVHLCEVTTHIGGVDYGGNQESVKRIKKKHNYQKLYAEKYLTNFNDIKFSFWSPYVPIGYITENLQEIDTLELVINKEYGSRIEEMKKLAESKTNDTGNPFFRMLQILENIRE